ncbi:MAG: dihydroxyacetone kinase subunit L [Alphaproteobacteria bacterium]|jgi:phosphoenolpyruvate---glycerone phosphotransferase subunit DhaL|nr:dihydroxyacetone kinase subunit L [Alphaproteobacteria bacterium]
MTETLNAGSSRAMLEAVSRFVIERTDMLTDADLAIGDGDHGIGMRRGFEAALSALETQPVDTPESAFKVVGTAILSNTGGAAGAVFGTLFRAGSKAFAGKDAIDGDGFAAFLESGLEAIIKRGGVTEGQKTMIDAIGPAARAARGNVGKGLSAVVASAAEASLSGVEATRDMIATTGKARSLGERSLGHPDPGAISISLILKAMQEFTATA